MAEIFRMSTEGCILCGHLLLAERSPAAALPGVLHQDCGSGGNKLFDF